MKSLIICFLMISTIDASDIKLASSIFNNIISAITYKTKSFVYIHTQVDTIEKYPGNLIRVYDCKEADVVVLSNTKNIPDSCSGKILFGTRYYHMEHNDVVGSFFWQKGRPNILFYQKRLEKYNIRLESDYDKYIEY